MLMRRWWMDLHPVMMVVAMQVDAVKRNCIKVLPHMLVIHLKRFEYDYETMNRWKIKDR